MKHVHLNVNGERRFQVMEGFGANINPVNHWRDGELVPVLDLLIDDLGASLFRLDPYGFSNWIDPDSTGDRSLLHADRWPHIYRSQPFQDAWNTARYLNKKGARIILNVSGVVPKWMCSEDGHTLVDIDAYAELLTSLALWARHEERITFDLFGPFNETDIGPPEGPVADPSMVASALQRVAERFQQVGLDDIRFVAVDQAYYNLEYLQPIVLNDYLRERVAVAGMHCYSDIPLHAVRDLLAAEKLEHWSYWLSEYGDLDQSGEHEWDVAIRSTRRLLRGINDGVQAAMVWDAYDNWHGHDNSWSIYGLLRKAIRCYTPKPRYYAAKHLYRFVPPGAQRLEITTDNELSSMNYAAFQTADHDLTLVGLNEAEPYLLDLHIAAGVAAGREAHLYLSNSTQRCSHIATFPISEHLAFVIPAQSIFTLSTIPI